MKTGDAPVEPVEPADPTDPFDIVRRLYRAVRESDLDTIARLHAPDAVAEQVFDHATIVEGRDAIVAAYRAHPPRADVNVRTIGGIETGWGWVQAEWTEINRDSPSFRLGHSHFLVENALIRRHRRVITKEGEGEADRAEVAASSRRYPTRPITGVGAVILAPGKRGPGVVLVKRRHEPLAGHWTLPGGTLDLGETLESGAAREALEETGLVVDVGPVVDVFDRILLDEAGKVRYHFVLIDYLCRTVGGELRAGSDAADVVIANTEELENYRLTGKASDVITKAMKMEPNAWSLRDERNSGTRESS